MLNQLVIGLGSKHLICRYDIILNCGGRNTLNFARHQFISSQRRVDTVTNQIRTVDQVALRSLDNKVIIMGLYKSLTNISLRKTSSAFTSRLEQKLTTGMAHN